MRAIVGLGNPGEKYLMTRHNVGYMFVDYLAQSHSISFHPARGEFYMAKGLLQDIPFLLLKPTSYMNLSGRVLKQLVDRYNVLIKEILIVYDDIHLNFGDFKVRASGGDGGHNGIRSIINQFNTTRFPKIRIGIKKDDLQGKHVSEFVLSEFSNEEIKSLIEIFYLCKSLGDEFIVGGTRKMMDKNSILKNKQKNNISETQES